jgi:hypothetical protein
MEKFVLRRPSPQQHNESGDGGDHVGPVSRHKSVSQRIQEEFAEARALDDATKLAPGNVRILRTWESLSPAERAMFEEEVDERRRRQERLNAYGPEPLPYEYFYYGDH